MICRDNSAGLVVIIIKHLVSETSAPATDVARTKPASRRIHKPLHGVERDRERSVSGP